MKVRMVGPTSGYGPNGYQSWAADEVVEIDDGDQATVAWYRNHCAGGGGTILEDVKPPAKSAMPSVVADEVNLDRLRSEAEALGIKVDGRWSAQRLQQEIAKARRG